ncbi:peptidase G2 autoproteolytic cleavage domain-containing protein, partial [Bacillus cereus]|uniref:peptidase G2 autoproteolytic cleavage domain-containing protein n=1 Tax=Bacillus cereus TaxID=1396 RepID=UPI000BEBE36E
SAHAEGTHTVAAGVASHAEGSSTNAYGNNSHTEGSYTTTGDSEDPLQGDSAHAEGHFTIAYGDNSHAEGYFTFARGDSSHTEGFYTVARGKASHAEGAHTIAEGKFSHAEGVNTQAVGDYSHVEGIGNSSEFEGAHIMGKYGNAQESYSWFIGNGLSANNREIGAKWLASTRNMYIDGHTYVAGGTNYAEMFKIKNDAIDIGFFVTFDGEYVRKATHQDDYILGITCATPSILGNSAEMRWKEKYLVDEWGRMQYENQIGSGIIKKRAILNPKWDPEKEYIPRNERSEWVSVGLLGQILVRDDGTCKVGKYCFPNIEGIATNSNTGYLVIQRINLNQILILFR